MGVQNHPLIQVNVEDCRLDMSQFKCVNYGKSYSAAYGSCSVYKGAKKVKTVFVTKRVSETDVRKYMQEQSLLILQLMLFSHRIVSLHIFLPYASYSSFCTFVDPRFPLRLMIRTSLACNWYTGHGSLGSVFIGCMSILSQGFINVVDVILPLANRMLGLTISRSTFDTPSSAPLASVSDSPVICTEQPLPYVANDVAPPGDSSASAFVGFYGS